MSAVRLAFTRLSWRTLPLRSAVAVRSIQRVVAPAVINTSILCRYGSSKPEESDEEFDARWLAYFNRPDLDTWDLKWGLNEIYGHDLVPEPKIIIAMLQAARRLNDVALAIRILEAIKSKAAGNKEIYNYVIAEIKPTLDELGIRTPEELGLA